MKILLALILLAFNVTASETLWLYNVDRDGEGMVMTKLDRKSVV